MRQNIEMKEADYYRTYLLGHLRDHFFPQATDSKFIDTRVNEAYERFTALRLEGKSVIVAQELAMRTLLEGLYVSRYDILYNIVEESLWTRLPEEYWADFTIHLLTVKKIHDILDRYGINGDFLERETHQPMLDELLGLITDILDGYGL